MVCPGEILAMLGPSGSGKTTLLTALGGRLSGRLSGKITYNGQSFSGSIKRKTGFVAQDDVLYPHLTCRNSMIGGALFRGISGGEKKRVSIGQEMLMNPSLLLLDEPTSGLDSTSAQRILHTVKGLPSGGRTIITTIHQPSSRVYYMFNKVVLLSEGFPIYYGLPSTALEYFSSLGFSTSIIVNPADLLLDHANGIGPEQHATDYSDNTQQDPTTVREFLISSYDRNISTRLEAELYSLEVSSYNYTKETSTRNDAKLDKWSTTWWYQFKILLLRIAMLFFFSVFWGFYPLYNAVFTFPQERSMLIKERSSGMYRLSSYFLARTVGVDLPLELGLPIAFTVIFYWMGGLKPDPATFTLSLLIVLFSVLVSQSLGLAFGAILMDVKKAATLASVTTLVFIIAGGYYVRQIPPFIVWVKYVSYSYYCYKLLLGVQYNEADYYECGKGVHCRVADYPPVKSVGLSHCGWICQSWCSCWWAIDLLLI
ncbi:hypothetical protein RD792_008956 [Penstemon davidsonii]|uniref:ABC transporter domain-containing protein n=1 Tax=Penstemon davidsonii TaxID=160366 RepID=A0ABR0DAL8_9LAMI|nr:hypothetical protein RD792_008956 [Penstemon davidsonii]